jgi:hypothetical protein
MARKSSTLGRVDVAGLATVLSHDGFRNHMGCRDADICDGCAGARLAAISRDEKRLPTGDSVGVKTGSKFGPRPVE